MKPAAVTFSLLLMLGACARSEDASVQPAEGNGSAVEQVRTADADEQEPALGEWRRGLQEERPALEFGPAGTAPLVTLICGERGGIVIQRAGALAPGSAPSLSVTVSRQGRQLPVTAAPGPTPMQRASIPPGDTLLQQLAGAQAPIALRFGDGTSLILPQSPLIGAFATGCAEGMRQGTIGAPAAAGGNAQSDAPPAAAAGNEANAAAPR